MTDKKSMGTVFSCYSPGLFSLINVGLSYYQLNMKTIPPLPGQRASSSWASVEDVRWNQLALIKSIFPLLSHLPVEVFKGPRTVDEQPLSRFWEVNGPISEAALGRHA